MIRRCGVLLQARDMLFGDVQAPAGVSAGGVLLARSPFDDYVRFRVPDTDCPWLPEPSTPIDSGVADEAEPARWTFSGECLPVTGWRFRGEPGDAGQGLHQVQPSYLCYDGDFVTELRCQWSDAGLPRQHQGIAADFDLFIWDIGVGLGAGICLGALGGESGMQPWQMGVWAYVNGAVSTQLGWAWANTDFVWRLQRTGTTITAQFVGGDSAVVATGVSGPCLLRCRRDYTLQGQTGRHLPAVTVSRWQTLSGAPASVTVTTAVIDMEVSRPVTITRTPTIGVLSWRAQDTPFARDDAQPAWTNPTDPYRYWQARVTWSDPTQLLERVTFAGATVVPVIAEKEEHYEHARLLSVRTHGAAPHALEHGHWWNDGQTDAQGNLSNQQPSTLTNLYVNLERRP